MNVVEYISNWWKEALEYKKRVLKDGGTTKREDNVQRYYQMCKEQGILNSIKFAWLGEAGGKFRDSGANRFWTKLYSLVTTNDATQTTSTSQLPLGGNIAPTEKWCLKNPNGGSNYMTHPTISFAANEQWSVTTVVNWNKQNYASASRISDNILLDANLNGTLRFSFSGFAVQVAANTLYRYIGKNCTITTTCNNGTVEFYINGISIPVAASSGTYVGASFKNINDPSIATSVAGSINAHIIRAQAITPTQVAAEANFLRSLYPEIPSVQIGTQTWATSNCEMVATPQGNLIQNVTANSNVEKITSYDFTTGWTFTNASALNATTFATTATGGIQKAILTTDKFYKLTISGTTTASGFGVPNGTVTTFYYSTGTGAFSATIYFKALDTAFYLRNIGVGTTTINTLSVQEVGWSDATNLYNYVYANTAGTDEQKTYAAVKAAAMWRYPNNDAAIGVIYNKLFNDYATKLLAMDIAYYNTANPTTPWGWDIPTEAEWTTLQTTVNNNAEALKKDGTVYWSSPNAGTNSSFFTAIPAGYVKEDGTFSGLNTAAIFASKDNMDIPRVGKSIRLIKK